MESFRLSQEEIERLFAGKSASADPENSEMAAFIEEVRADSTSGLAPSFEAAQLAALLEVVHNTEMGELAARPAGKVAGPDGQASGLPKWRTRMFGNAAGALAIKILGGTVALAASTVGLAAADLLGQAQTPVADVVKNVAGVDLPGATDKVKGDKGDKDDKDADLAKSDENEAEIDLDETDEGQVPVNHGQYVSCVAHMAHDDESLTPGQRGQIVSFAAGQKDVTLSKDADDEQCEAAYDLAKAGAGVVSVEGEKGPGNSQGHKDADNQADKAGERPDKPEQAEDPSVNKSNRGPGGGGFSSGQGSGRGPGADDEAGS